MRFRLWWLAILMVFSLGILWENTTTTNPLNDVIESTARMITNDSTLEEATPEWRDGGAVVLDLNVDNEISMTKYKLELNSPSNRTNFFRSTLRSFWNSYDCFAWDDVLPLDISLNEREF